MTTKEGQEARRSVALLALRAHCAAVHEDTGGLTSITLVNAYEDEVAVFTPDKEGDENGAWQYALMRMTEQACWLLDMDGVLTGYIKLSETILGESVLLGRNALCGVRVYGTLDGAVEILKQAQVGLSKVPVMNLSLDMVEVLRQFSPHLKRYSAMANTIADTWRVE